MINIKDFDSKLLKIDKKSYKNMNICYIGYITIKKVDDYENIHTVNPLHLIIDKVDGFIAEKNENKYLFFLIKQNCNSTDENKEVLKKYTELYDSVKNEIKTINGGKKFEYAKNFMKIKFNSDDDMPLDEPLKVPAIIIVVRSVSEEDGKFHPQIYLDECSYEL